MHEPSTHRSLSMALTTLAAACTALILAGCASQPGAAGTDRSVTIERTTYGIPHITQTTPNRWPTAWRTPTRKTTSA